jgi:hypothetical protein
MSGDLWVLLDAWEELDARWEKDHTEESRVAMQEAWHVDSFRHAVVKRGDVARCQALVLSRDSRSWSQGYDAPETGELLFRGACRGCGWVAPEVREDENPAAEDAVDHAWPGWRELPVVGHLPWAEGPKALVQKQGVWLRRWGPSFPAGWLEAGGPIRTEREPMGTRHVPGRTPWGGYDMAVMKPLALPSGQLVLALELPEPARRVARRPARVMVNGREVEDVPTGDRL